MSDMKEDFQALKEFNKAKRTVYGRPCPQCNVKQPKRIPTLLQPQQRCRVDGYRDPRPYPTNEEMNVALDAHFANLRAQS